MSNHYAAVGSALNGYLGSVAQIPVFGWEAPQGSARPYVIFHRLADVQEYTFDSESFGADFAVQVISDHAYPDSEAYGLWSPIGSAMQNAPLNIAGYSLQRCEARSAIEYKDSDNFWHVGYTYRIEAYKQKGA